MTSSRHCTRWGLAAGNLGDDLPLTTGFDQDVRPDRNRVFLGPRIIMVSLRFPRGCFVRWSRISLDGSGIFLTPALAGAVRSR